jgi:hypothetical protein
MPELVLEDFSGGMDASIAVDKMDTKECLLAESARFDEAGNVLISGANSAQNSTAISDGTSSNVHSLFYDSAIGCIAGVGTDIWIGASPASLSDFSSINSTSAKMSFGAAPGRIYMDIGGVGYFKDVTLGSLLTVDWGPPDSAGATTTTKNAGTGVASGTGIAWASPNNITSTNSFALTTSALSTATPFSNMLLATNFGFAISATAIAGFTVSITAKSTTPAQLQVWLLRAGIPVGLVHVVILTADLTTYTFGATTDTWGITDWVQGDVNASTFGFQVRTVGDPTATVSMYHGQITVYQGVGMVAAGGALGTLTGTYSWKITFAGPNGEESQASTPSGNISLTAQQGTLTAIPIGDARTTARKIYRKGNLLSNYYLVGSLQDNASTTYSDNQTDIAALAEAVILAGDVVGDEPNTRLGNQTVKYPTPHYDRVFWASGDTLIWSKPLNGFAYPADFSTPVGDSKDITGIVSQGGELIIFKPDSIWRLTGTDENSFQLSRTLSPVGTDWPFSIAFAGGSSAGFYFTGRIIFANRHGIWAFNGYSSNKISSKLDLWFRQDDRTDVARARRERFPSSRDCQQYRDGGLPSGSQCFVLPAGLCGSRASGQQCHAGARSGTRANLETFLLRSVHVRRAGVRLLLCGQSFWRHCPARRLECNRGWFGRGRQLRLSDQVLRFENAGQ